MAIKLRDGHERVASVRKQPHHIKLREHAHRDGDAVDDPEGDLRLVAEEIDGAALAVHAPAEGCGEGEEGQADRHRDAADAGKRGFEGGGGHGGPSEAGGPLARSQG